MTALRAVLFDLDGVLTPTAAVHMRAWRMLFAPLCEEYGVAPYRDDDYFATIDGKPRFDGVAAFLESRGLSLPRGDVGDPAGDATICALGNRKNEIVNRIFAEEGVTPYPGSIAFLNAVQQAGVPVAVVSSSRNTPAVLAAAGLTQRFQVVVDGTRAAAENLPGKPAPDTYLRAAALLDVPPQRAAVVEDAVSGVQAGHAGGFGLVIGVDRGVGAPALTAGGADCVVGDLAELDANELFGTGGSA